MATDKPLQGESKKLYPYGLLGPYKAWKTAAAFIGTFLSVLILEDVIPHPWDVVAIALVTALTVWGIPNPMRGRRRAT